MINNTSFNISYEYGGKAALDKSWNRYGYCLSENKFFYILKGELVIRCNGVEHLCSEGDIVLIPSRLKHDFYLREDKPCVKYWFHFSVLKGNEQVTLLYDLPIRIHSNDASVKSLFSAVIKPVHNTADALLRVGKVSAILSYYIQKSGGGEKLAQPDEIDRTIEYIRANLSSPLSLNELSAKACLSPGYFVRKFHKKTGLSPMKYILLSRIYEAKRLLTDTNMPVSEIMTSVGIYDSAYFSKCFKSATGFSPRFFRKMAGKS